MTPSYIKKFGDLPLPIGVFGTPKGTLEIKIGQGRKCDADRTIYYRTKGASWQPLQMIDLAVLIAMTRHNESVNYPPPRYKGGAMFVELVDDVMLIGTQAAGNKHGVMEKRKQVVSTRRYEA